MAAQRVTEVPHVPKRAGSDAGKGPGGVPGYSAWSRATTAGGVSEKTNHAAEVLPGIPTGPFPLRGMRRVLELAKQPGDHEGDLLADVHRVVPDPLDRPRRQQ